MPFTHKRSSITILNRDTGGDTLTGTQEAVLAALRTGDGRLISNLPFETTLNSIYLGKIHKISSGGENAFFSNSISDIDFFPIWGGLRNHAEPTNHGYQGIVDTAARRYGANLQSIEGHGPVGTTIGDCLGVSTIDGINASVVGLDIIIGEVLPAGQVLFFHVYDGVDATDVDEQVYEQVLVLTSETAVGEAITLWLDHPIEAFSGQVTTAELRKDSKDGQFLQVLQNDTDDHYWSRFHFREFVDIPVQSIPWNTDQTSFTAMSAGHYVLDTTDGGITIDVPQTSIFFIVEELNNSWSDDNPVTLVVGPDNYILKNTTNNKIFRVNVREGFGGTITDASGKVLIGVTP